MGSLACLEEVHAAVAAALEAGGPHEASGEHLQPEPNRGAHQRGLRPRRRHAAVQLQRPQPRRQKEHGEHWRLPHGDAHGEGGAQDPCSSVVGLPRVRLRAPGPSPGVVRVTRVLGGGGPSHPEQQEDAKVEGAQGAGACDCWRDLRALGREGENAGNHSQGATINRPNAEELQGTEHVQSPGKGVIERQQHGVHVSRVARALRQGLCNVGGLHGEQRQQQYQEELA
mmetsp:Transcript_82321/g.233175  ORF Transcript_82321/g.233175 Transcript_82321/m.233175 type:complete len:227 (+) Transcript_82321:1479-2159(+)